MTSTTFGIFSSPLSSAESDSLTDIEDVPDIRLDADAIKSVPLPTLSMNGNAMPSLLPAVEELNKDNIDLSLDVDSDIEDALSEGLLSNDASEMDEDEALRREREVEELLKEKLEAWTESEIDEMMFFLKEEGMVEWLNKYIVERRIPVKKLIYAFPVLLSKKRLEMSDVALLPVLKAAMVRELRRRERLQQYSTLDDALFLLRRAQRIIVLTGAGISVSCGIPDFRSRNGLYAMLQESGLYGLDDPQQMFDITYFKEHPNVFYSFAHQIYPSNFKPSPCHRFIKALEDREKLLRNYTQNIDTLETLTGIKRVLQCHGSFATASCINCRTKVIGTDIKDDIMAKRIPLCKICNEASKQAEKPKKLKKKKKKKRTDGWESDVDEDMIPSYPPGIMKPDITFFGEKLTDDFDDKLMEDRKLTDLLLVIGTSLKVAPVAEILTHVPHSIPQIVINKTPIRHINPDIMLLGDADDIVKYLSDRLGWDIAQLSTSEGTLRNSRKRSSDLLTNKSKPRRVADSHIWLFEGAEGGKFVESIEAHYKERLAATPPSRRTSAANSRATSVSASKTPSIRSQSTESDNRSVKRMKSR
ncbi:SIR2-domain-containing protein [Schizopora paradoxa]|uniref:SIR2-domain-containing protein n=1 Tax=Schizopora paradoxa TaxID=27342 RepID=A0A0H2S4L0_9AGAM|nr:SIR2-domain-containing protein [Schizopora paradoxa]